MTKIEQFKRDFFYGIGNTGLAIVNIVVQTWLIYFFAPPEGRVLLPATLVGSIWFFGRIVDAVADPLVSNWTDRLSSPLGRRLPFLFLTSLPLAAVMFLLFFEPLFSGPAVLSGIVLAVLLGLFYFLFTAYAVPYLALIPDLSAERAGRLNLSTSSALFNLVGTAAAMILCGMLLGIFGGSGFSAKAFVPVMLIMAGAAFLTFILTPAGLLKYRREGASSTSLNVFSAMRTVFKNKAFLIYVFGMNVFWGGFIIINVSVPYYVTTLMGESADFTSIALGCTLGVALLFFAVIGWAARRFGNRKVMLVCCLILTAVLTLIFFIPKGLFGLSPKTSGLILMALAGAPISGLFILPNVMVAELSDFVLPDGTKPGEAIYFGVQGVINKFVIGVVTLFTGFLFDTFGATAAENFGVRLTGPIGGAFALFAFFMFLKYPEDRKKSDLVTNPGDR